MTSPLPGTVLALAESVHEAELLLRFASRNGLVLDNALIDTVVDIAAASAAGSVTPEQEKAFWPAFRELSRAAAPVTVESIRATVDSAPAMSSTLRLRLSNQPLSIARWCAFKYRWLGGLTLFTLIVVQIFWVVGVSIVNDTVALEREVETISAEITRKNLAGDQTAPSADVLKARLITREMWLSGNYQTLLEWNRFWARLVPLVKPPFESDAFVKLDSPAKNRVELISAGFALLALSTYVLPLMYGFLGACAYVLRDLAKEIRDVTFTAGDNIRYGLRLALGPLAGIAIGLFLAPDTVHTQAGTLELVKLAQPAADAARQGFGSLDINTLGPLGLAFLAGYSVELVFAAMDRIIGAFTGDTPRRRDPSGKPGPV